MERHTRNFSEIKSEKFDDEKLETLTSLEQVCGDLLEITLHYVFITLFSLCGLQIKVENLVEKCFDRIEQLSSMDNTLPYFYRKEHIRFLERCLRFLSTGYECLDASRTWLVYWILQSAHWLNFKFSYEVLADVIHFLKKCRCPSGGFSGGPSQLPHLAPTYAAVLSLCLIETDDALEAIDP